MKVYLLESKEIDSEIREREMKLLEREFKCLPNEFGSHTLVFARLEEDDSKRI